MSPIKFILLSTATLISLTLPSMAQVDGEASAIVAMPNFESFDTDNSNGVSRPEFLAGGIMNATQFNAADINSDESITLGEFNTFETALRHSNAAKGVDIDVSGNTAISFTGLDLDADNFVSQNEFTNNNGLTEAQFEDIDSDSDDRLTLTEMNAYQTSIRSSNDGSVRAP